LIKAARSWTKSFYDAVAIVAILNVLVLLALTGYFVLGGNVSVADVQRALVALRGDQPGLCPPATDAKAAATKPEIAGSRQPFSEVELDLMRIEAERLKTEVDQRVALANSIMLKVRTEREAFKKERETIQKQDDAEKAKLADSAFQKQLELFASLGPKMALEHLLALNDPEKAAQILAALDTDRAKKVIESAKKGDDLIKMKAILQKLETVRPHTGGQLQAKADES
jgi:hypothetical protein